MAGQLQEGRAVLVELFPGLLALLDSSKEGGFPRSALVSLHDVRHSRALLAGPRARLRRDFGAIGVCCLVADAFFGARGRNGIPEGGLRENEG